jgi:hypothetical protein
MTKQKGEKNAQNAAVSLSELVARLVVENTECTDGYARFMRSCASPDGNTLRSKRKREGKRRRKRNVSK